MEIVKVFKNNNESEKDIILYCSILKREFRISCSKAVEIGVKEIIPIITKRTVKLNLNTTGWKKLLKKRQNNQAGNIADFAQGNGF